MECNSLVITAYVSKSTSVDQDFLLKVNKPTETHNALVIYLVHSPDTNELYTCVSESVAPHSYSSVKQYAIESGLFGGIDLQTPAKVFQRADDQIWEEQEIRSANDELSQDQYCDELKLAGMLDKRLSEFAAGAYSHVDGAIGYEFLREHALPLLTSDFKMSVNLPLSTSYSSAPVIQSSRHHIANQRFH